MYEVIRLQHMQFQDVCMRCGVVVPDYVSDGAIVKIKFSGSELPYLTPPQVWI